MRPVFHACGQRKGATVGFYNVCWSREKIVAVILIPQSGGGRTFAPTAEAKMFFL